MSRLTTMLAENFLPPPEDIARLKQWFWDTGCWHLLSGLGHATLVVSLALIPYAIHKRNATTFEAAIVDTTVELEPFVVGDTPVDPTELSTDTLQLEAPKVEAMYIDNSPDFEMQGGGVQAEGPTLGGAGGPNLRAIGEGPKLPGMGGIGGSNENGAHAGLGGAGEGFAGRGSGHRDAMLGSYGGTKASERAVAAALNWLARHQSSGGGWSLSNYQQRCKGAKCSGIGHVTADAAATAMGVLPFLAAGQTQASEGPYKAHIDKAIRFLVNAQKPDGLLAAAGEQPMYSHGLATIALCEDFGLTKDPKVGIAAQSAIKFIERAQNKNTGGWRYQPGDDGDTSVVGWQVMALKSAQMAGLAVDSSAFEGARRWLGSVKKSTRGGLFSYEPFQEPKPTMTAVGLLCSQYLGARRDDPAMNEGKAYLLGNSPENGLRDIYYWYYATQVMHNILGPDWDRWNRQMRRILIQTQNKDGCASGSWDPANPTPDAWGDQGGRLMMTSLSALTLEVYYRYLPLYQMETGDGKTPPQTASMKQ
jgi:hypothetical protein